MTLVNCTLIARRPSAFQAGHIPSWRESRESYALSPVADDSGWPLLLLSAVGSVPHFHGLPADSVTPWSSPPSPGLFPATRPRPVLSQAPPPNPIAAEPYGRRVLSRGGAAHHAVTPEAPLTGSGCREYSYGGFGGGHPHFHPHADDLRITRVFSCVGRGLEGRAGFMFAGCCWWRSLAVGGGLGTSRGHAPVMRGPGSRRRGAAARHPAPPREPLVALGPLRVWLCTHAREVRLPEADTYPRNMPPGANGVRDLLSAAAPSWTFSMPVACVIQDHPAHTP